MKQSPCWNNGQDCPKRTTHPTNCHETCKEYKDWVEDCAKEKIANASQKAYLGYYFNILEKSRKRGNHK